MSVRLTDGPSWKIHVCSKNKWTLLENYKKVAPGKKEQIFSKTVSVAASALWREYAANLYNSGSYMFSSLVKTQFNNTVELQSTNFTSFKQVEDIINFVEPTEDLKSTQCTFVGAVFIHHVKCMFCKILIPMDEDIEKENNAKRLVTSQTKTNGITSNPKTC